MTIRFAPNNLDIEAFAQAGAELTDTVPLTHFERVMDELRDHAKALGVDWAAVAPVRWTARGEQRQALGGEPQTWLLLQAQASAPMCCQRCLERVDEDLVVDYWFRFVADEATADAQDDELEEDLLVTSQHFDMVSLVEDELLMALPMVPLHEICPAPVKLTVADPDFEEAAAPKAHPFAALAKFKK